LGKEFSTDQLVLGIPTQVGYNSCPNFKIKRGGTLDTQKIVKELKAERNRLDRAIAALDEANDTGATVATDEPASKGAHIPKKRDGMSAAGRKRISVMMKKRWAERRKKGASRRT
jgi:hypothetical protein